MSLLLEQPRGRADAIPALLVESPSSAGPLPYTRRLLDHADCSPDCSPRSCSAAPCQTEVIVVESPSSSSAESFPPHPHHHHQHHQPPPSPDAARDDQDDAHADQDEPDMLSAPRLDAPGADVPAPALPAKSALRTSRLLASLAQKTAPEDRPILPHAAPHQVYLSSEEDASSSADDLSDLEDLDWDAQDANQASSSSASSSASRSSRADTARVVTVIFHGRPSIIDLPPRSFGASADARRPATGILRTATEPTLVRTRSNSSSSSAAMKHPPRSSSMLPTGFQMKRPQFLTIDPFASKPADPEEQDSARTPKTPSGVLKKTLSLVKKRSRPLLNNQAATRSRESLALPTPPMEHPGEEADAPTPRDTYASHRSSSISYQGLMRSARRSAEATAPAKTDASTSHRSRFRNGLSISRPRSSVRT
ncbi:hypothetical protein CDD83_1646 [Cordyceps sp. RAO-2017]|nr:hypothetical protein CDD83_1646 [Cordyceps sp. RAO-2017]